MSDSNFIATEGGLRAPPELGFWGKAWWWFHFLILVKIARLRFLAVLLVIGLVIVKWDTLLKHYDRWLQPAVAEHGMHSGDEWFCPMHPAIVRDNPKDKCPICFMPLSKRTKSEHDAAPLPPGVVSRVQLSPYRMVLGGVRTWTVAPVSLRHEINSVGFVEFNEREMKHVAARVKGRIDKLNVAETGRMVHAGDELASLYSPDLTLAMQNLVDAQRANNKDLFASSRERLLRWGMSFQQLDRILKTGKADTHLMISAPITGHVLRKFVKEGQYVDEGSPLYDVVDLTTVWIQVQVYEDDMAYFPGDNCPIKDVVEKREGLLVTATTRAYPNEKFVGRLSFILPHVDVDTRTVVVRFELDNPDHKLRPGTSLAAKIQVPPAKLPALGQAFVRVTQQRTMAQATAQGLLGTQLAIGLAGALLSAGDFALLAQGRALAVPEGAVIDTGAQQLVYRETAPGEYEGVQVELGRRLTGPDDVNYFPVVAGLQAGDRVVTAGSFLIDAETRLNPAAGSIYLGGGGKSGTQVQPSTPAPTGPKKATSEEEKNIAEELAKLDPKDRILAKAQRFCAFTENSRLGSMGEPLKLIIDNQPVFLCCDGCRSGALANPAKTLERVRQLLSKTTKAK